MNWEGELINWFIDWLIDCSSLYWYGIGGVDFWCVQGIGGFNIWWMVVVVRVRIWMEPKVDLSDSFFTIVIIARLFVHKNEMGSSDSIIRHFRFVTYVLHSVDFILTQLPNRRKWWHGENNLWKSNLSIDTRPSLYLQLLQCNFAWLWQGETTVVEGNQRRIRWYEPVYEYSIIYALALLSSCTMRYVLLRSDYHA